MEILRNKSLKNLNTFNVDVKAKEYIDINTPKDIEELYKKGVFKKRFFILGGGSNTLFVNDFDGVVININILGKEVVEENKKNILVSVGAGETWDDFVKWSIDKNLLGLQNLANIPGSCGATPVQNVGAYGVEVKDFIEYLEIFDIESGDFRVIDGKDCEFGYRDSIFKNKLKDKVIITNVIFRLEKWEKEEEIPHKYLEYKGIREKLETNYDKPYTLEKVYNAVIEIRDEKLPKVDEYGSCGSTFANPIINKETYEQLLKKYPELPKYPVEGKGGVKIPAAYILEKMGWKNRKVGKSGTWVQHPLIVTNYDNASGKEIYNLILDIQKDFFDNTGVKLDTEINIIF